MIATASRLRSTITACRAAITTTATGQAAAVATGGGVESSTTTATGDNDTGLVVSVAIDGGNHLSGNIGGATAGTAITIGVAAAIETTATA